MLFTEPTFLFLFLPVLLALYVIRREHPSDANWLLLAASVVFYAKGGGWFTLVILGSIAFNYRMAMAIDAARTRRLAWRLLVAAVGVNLAVLGVFKYTNFAADNLSALLSGLGAQPLAVPHVLLPIGVSFFTFHAISYVVDVYRRDAPAQKSAVRAGLYLLLFPQLIAGPIIRYRQIADQLARRTLTLTDFAAGTHRFAIGLGKKVLIANAVAEAADGIFNMPAAQLTPAHAWLGIVCYTLQIYFDFSGYSDMAIGLGRMFGFRFPENFRWPYVAGSVQEFWRRWHITLSSWFRDYLYVPLGGSRVSPARTYLNLITVFFLCGLWHGASWTFVMWGLFHGSFLVLERRGLASFLERAWRPLRHVYLLAVVMVGWVFFRADTYEHAIGFLAAMSGRMPAEPTPYAVGWFLSPTLLIALGAGFVGSFPIGPAVDRWTRRAPVSGSPRWGLATANTALIAIVLIASVMQIAARTYDPFIYFRF